MDLDDEKVNKLKTICKKAGCKFKHKVNEHREYRKTVESLEELNYLENTLNLKSYKDIKIEF